MHLVFGGSFDPIHRGHVAMADAAQCQVQPERLFWVPSFHAPHKPEQPPVGAEHRLQFVQAVVRERPGEQVLDWEIQRQTWSYTVDTLRFLATEYPQANWGFLLGADSLAHLATWRCLEEICRRVRFFFAPREGWGERELRRFQQRLDPQLAACFRARMLVMRPVDASSTAIRAALAAGQLPESIPLAAAELIRRHGLYGIAPADYQS